ncbi:MULTISPECIES: hypothetical protein [Bacillus]|nr:MULTISPECIES: hypothetical protein [Bacillus]
MKENDQVKKDKNLKDDSYERDVVSKEMLHLDYVPEPHGVIGQQLTNNSE